MSNFSVKDLQSIKTTDKYYGLSLQILARMGVLEFLKKNPNTIRKEKNEKELNELSGKLYLPKVGDAILFENFKTGHRYKCLAKEVREDGWVIGEPVSFHRDYYFLLEVFRNNKRIYSW